ncbi:MAG: hypothetical protein Q9203_006539, partial [Teloschistes exilis]
NGVDIFVDTISSFSDVRANALRRPVDATAAMMLHLYLKNLVKEAAYKCAKTEIMEESHTTSPLQRVAMNYRNMGLNFEQASQILTVPIADWSSKNRDIRNDIFPSPAM